MKNIDKTHLHAIEGALELYSTDPWVFQPAELYKFDKDFRNELTEHNLYIVASRKRITIDFKSLKIEDSGKSISGNFFVHIQDEKKSFPFSMLSPEDGLITEIGKTDYPHNYLRIVVDGLSRIQIRIYDLIRLSENSLNECSNLKVEYIGQSYGDKGSSNAMTRLIGKTGKQGHGSLQKVLAELNSNHPDEEAHILLYSFEFYKNHIRNSIFETVHDFDYDPGRFDGLLSAEYSKANRIDLVEAGLIRYFQPKYNEIYKTTFPQKTHNMLQSLFNHDVTGLAISLSTEEHNLSLYSEEIPPNKFPWHCPSFPILNDYDRASFLDI